MSQDKFSQSPRQIRQACESHMSEPIPVILPTNDCNYYLETMARKPVPNFYNTFQDFMLRESESCYELYPCPNLSLLGYSFIHKYLDYGFMEADIIKFIKLFRFRMTIRLGKERTLIPLRYVYSIFKNSLNDLGLTSRYSHKLSEFPFLIFSALVDLEQYPVSYFKYSAVANVKYLHSQIPQLLTYMARQNMLLEDYAFLTTLQNFIHFYHRSLHFTNPTAILEHRFVVSFTDLCTKLVCVRPIVNKKLTHDDSYIEFVDEKLEPTDKERQIREFLEMYLQDKRSIAQIGVDVKMDPKFVRSIDRLADMFGEAAKSLHSVAGTAVDGIRKKFACYLSICYNLFRATQGAMNYQDAFVNIVTTVMQSDIPTRLLPQFRDCFFSTKAQSGLCDGDVVIKLIAVATFVLMVKKIPTSREIDSFVIRLDRFPKAMNGVTAVWDKLDTITPNIWSWIETSVLGREKRIPRTEILDDVTRWVNELSNLLTLAARREIQNSKQTQERAGRMYSEGVRLMRECKELNLSRANTELIARNLPAAKLLLDEANSSGANMSRIRTEPVIVWFAGPSGNGKTGLVMPFVIDMMRANGETVPDNWEERIFTRMPENVYWEGLTPQKDMFIIDEFAQQKDNVLKPDVSLFEIIRLGNMFPYQAHMANLQDKANTFAEPKLMVLTSNPETVQVESLNCPTAVTRRIDYAYRVDIAPEYRLHYIDANREECYRLDAEKARKEFGAEICLQVYRMERFDPTTGKTLERDLTYSQVVEVCQAAMRKNATRFSKTQTFLDAYRIRGLDAYASVKHETVDEPKVDLDVYRRTATFTSGKTESVAQIGFDSWFNRPYQELSLAIRNPSPWYERWYENITSKYYQYVNTVEDDGFVTWINGNRNEAIQKCRNVISETLFRLNCERRAIVDTLTDILGPYWNAFKIIARMAIGITAFWILGKTFLKTWNKSDVPDFIQKDETLLSLTRRANQCLDNGCSDCIKCTHKNTDLCIKWYTKCTCYAAQMEKTKTFLKHYAVAALNQVPEHKDEKEICIELLSIVEQMCNCDCVNCDACCDIELMDRFSNVAKVYDIPCVCICARLSQGYSLPEILYLVRACGNIHPSPISNVYLKKLYRKMASDVNYFASTSDGINLESMIQSGELKGMTSKEKQSGEFSGQALNRVKPAIRYQSEDQQDTELDSKPAVKYAKDTIQPMKQSGEFRGNVVKAAKPAIQYQSVEVETTVPDSNPVGLYTKDTTQDQTPPVDISRIVALQEQRCLPENDASVDTIVNYVVYPNTAYMTAVDGDGREVSIGHILFVCGRTALMPYHYRVAIEERGFKSVRLHLRVAITTNIPVSIFEKYIRIPSKDAMLIEFPVIVNSFKNILGHFVDIQDYPKLPSCPGVLVKYHYENGVTERSRMYVNSIGVSEKDEVDEMTVPGCLEIVRNREFYTYSGPTRAGDCGSALVISNTGVIGKVIGIHVSGVPGLCRGNAAAITKQMLQKALQHVSSMAQYAYPSTPLTLDDDTLLESGSFVLHSFHKDERLNSAVKSSVRKTPIHGQLLNPSPNAPPRLRPFTNSAGEYVDPVLLQRKKYGIPRPMLDQAIVDDIRDTLKPLYYQPSAYEPEYYRYPLTTEQAILGIPGEPYIRALDRTTSPGYPDVLSKRIKGGKKDWFGDGMDYDLTTPKAIELMSRIEEFESSVVAGIRPEVPFIDTLKANQKLPLAKVQAGKTRLFAASGMVYAIVLRKLCAPFVAHLARNRIRNSICVGVNPFSTEWSAVARRLQQRGNRVIAGDYSNFDGSLPAQLVFAATEIFTDWYELNWEFVLAHKRNVIAGIELTKCQFLDFCMRVYYECVHHLHITNVDGGTVLYYVRNGIPSGCPVTAPLNSMVNMFALAYCWVDVFQDTQWQAVDKFLECTSAVFYGDDFVMNIREDVIDRYNQVTITEAMERLLDMVMTDETKAGEAISSRTLEKCTFLKRGFRFESSIQEFVAPLELMVILDTTNWFNLGDVPPLEVCKDVLEASLCELSLHSPEVDREWRSAINRLGLEVCSHVPDAVFKNTTRRAVLLGIKQQEVIEGLDVL